MNDIDCYCCIYHIHLSQLILDIWTNYVTVGEVLLGGYLCHFLPFFFVDRTLFLHHYLPAYAYKIMLSAFVITHIHQVMRLVQKRKIQILYYEQFVTSESNDNIFSGTISQADCWISYLYRLHLFGSSESHISSNSLRYSRMDHIHSQQMMLEVYDGKTLGISSFINLRKKIDHDYLKMK